MQIAEKYRPKCLAQVVGQRETVESLEAMLSRGLQSSAFYFVGASGTGKTTIGRALVAELGVHPDDTITIPGADVTAEIIRDLRNTFALSTWGESGWKACIVDEAHGMSKQAIQLLLPYLEGLPAKRLFVFTSTEKLDGDMFGNFTNPLASRCKVFELSADLNAMAEHAAGIASDEGLNGQPLEAYTDLLRSCNGNLRAALQKIEAGVMLRPFVYVPPAVVPSNPSKRATAQAPQREICPKAIETVKSLQSQGMEPCSDEGKAIAAELEFGKRFLPGTKNPKYFAHLERLKALRAQ